MLGQYITIDNKEYLLKATVNSMIEFMNKYPTIFKKFTDGMVDIEVIRILFYLQLKNKENDLKKLKLEDAGEMMTQYFEDGGGYKEFMTLVATVQAECLGMGELTDEIEEQVEQTEDSGGNQ